MNYYILALKKYVVFSGRASRPEFWYFILFTVIVSIVLSVIASIAGLADDSGGNILTNIYSLAVALPTLGVTIRRMHDSNRSGWWYLMPIYNIILMFLSGTKGPNDYGPESKGLEK